MTRSRGGQTWLYAFMATAVLCVALFQWPRRWLMSGAGPATYCILAVAAQHGRVFPTMSLWTLIATVNLAYAVAATSWFLYGVFAVTCYPAVFVFSVFQFQPLGRFVKRRLQSLLMGLQFTRDKIALFNLPALEIDRDVDGLMVIRGATISLSSLTVVVHGIEVGIKFSDDMELALVVDTVTIRLFRRIDVSDVYANVKGGEHEMTFHHLDTKTETNGRALMDSDTPLLNRAAATGDSPSREKEFMAEEMTSHAPPVDSTTREAMRAIEQISPDEHNAGERYQKTLDWIESSSAIGRSREAVRDRVKEVDSPLFDPDQDEKGFRAAICSNLHTRPTIAHPPKQSVRVTTLQNLSSEAQRRFMHRLPLLLRVLLNPLAYFHPIKIASITAGASGKWASAMLQTHVFSAIGDSEADIKHLKRRISTWLADANFAAQLVDIDAQAQVPIITTADIKATLSISDVLAYRALPTQTLLKQVARIGGADASLSIPTYLLPHHEHLLPPTPSESDIRARERDEHNAAGTPEAVRARASIAQLRADETNMRVAAHAHLPAVIDQDLLNFVAAVVKASKIIEIERDDSPLPTMPAQQSDSDSSESTSTSPTSTSTSTTATANANATPTAPARSSNPFDRGLDRALGERDIRSFRDLGRTVARHVGETMRDGMKKAAVDATVNDRFIAKLVGKVCRRLERAQGDVGYSGNVPLGLKVYRERGRGAASKILA